MILQRLVVENFRPYAGRTEVEFAAQGPRNVTVICGRNGTGKSSLFMAMKWCFWGMAGVEQRNLASTSAIRDLAARSSLETRVEVSYEHEGATFKAIRSFRTQVGEPLPTGEPSYLSEPTSQFRLFRIHADTGEADAVLTTYDEVSRAVPREALDYFFFDGEQIRQFADDGSSTLVREAVQKVLRFHELESAGRHVDQARQEYARRLKRAAGPDAEDLIRRREELNEEASQLRSEIGELATQVDAARRVNDGYVSRLEDLASVTELARERTEVAGRLEALERARDDALSAIQSSLGQLTFSVATRALGEARIVVDAKRKRGEIPAKVKSQVLRDWLEAEACICGRPLPAGTDARAAVEAHLNHSVPSRTEDELSLLGGNIDLCLREGAAKEEVTRLNLSRLGQARDMTQAMTDRLRQIQSELGSHPDEDVAKIAANAYRSRNDLEDLTTRRAGREADLATKQGLIDQISGQIAGVEFHNREAKRLETRIDLAARTVSALRDLRTRFESDIRERIEAETTRLFPELIWKEGYYSGVTLSQDFRLEALDPWGDPAFSTGGTSVGEARVLSLAFIVAMQVVARDSIDARAPAVVDSPFGNLSVEPIQRICAKLPRLVDQIVLFLTEADWQWAEEPLRSRLGKSYEIHFDEVSKVSSVVEAS